MDRSRAIKIELIFVFLALTGCMADAGKQFDHCTVQTLIPVSGGILVGCYDSDSVYNWVPPDGPSLKIGLPGPLTAMAAVGENLFVVATADKRLSMLDIKGNLLTSLSTQSFAHLAASDGASLIVNQSGGKPIILTNIDAGKYSTVEPRLPFEIFGTEAVAISELHNIVLFSATTTDSPLYPSRYLFALNLNGKMLWEVKPPGGQVNSLAISPNGQRILLAGKTGRLISINATNGSILWTARNAEGFSEVKFFEKGNRIVTSDFSGTVTLWDVANGSALTKQTLHGPGYVALAVYDCYSFISGGSDGRVMLTETGNQCVE